MSTREIRIEGEVNKNYDSFDNINFQRKAGDKHCLKATLIIHKPERTATLSESEVRKVLQKAAPVGDVDFIDVAINKLFGEG